MSFNARANEIELVSENELIFNSDLIFVGEVKKISTKDCLPGYKCARINIIRIIKGNAFIDVKYAYGSNVSEFNPACCKIGLKYIFFLKRLGPETYVSTDLSNSVYQIY